jgi:hypothetical protein
MYLSWLNEVELRFAKTLRDVIAHGVFTPLEDSTLTLSPACKGAYISEIDAWLLCYTRQITGVFRSSLQSLPFSNPLGFPS